MLQLANHTGFTAAPALMPDTDGVDNLILAVKASFSLGPEPKLAEEPFPFVPADMYYGDPADTSLQYAGEFHLPKPGTDVIVTGSARVPGGGRAEWLDAGVQVGPVLKRVRIFGDRSWRRGMMGTGFTQPKPFTTMPLVWERAYGGARKGDKPDFLETNPVGRGYGGVTDGDLLPNLEDPFKPIKSPGSKPDPVCFSFVAPAWRPRKDYAGTYDQAWQKNRAPYLPKDFDPRFFNCAHPDLICDGYLQGGETVALLNLTAWEKLQFALPTVNPVASVTMDGTAHPLALNLETVILATDHDYLGLIWRGAFPCDKKALDIQQITLETA